MARYEIQDDQGRKLKIDVEGDLTPEIAEQAFANYDALQIASAGPRGSEARRRAQANVVARENESTIADVSGGNESGAALSGAASVGRELNRFGGSGVAGLGRAASYLIDAIGGPVADQNLRPEELTAGPILERSEANLLTRAGTSIREQGEAFYPVNPNQKAANLAGSAVGSVVGFIGLGPAATDGYALSSGEQGLQDALAAGATPEQAIQQGIVEAATGAVMGRALGVVPGLREASRGAMRGVARPTAKTIAGEAIQEPLEGALNRASARFVTGSDPNAQPLDPETLALEAAGGAVGGAVAGGAISAANARDRANRLAAIRQQRDPFNQLNQIVENAPIDSPQMALVAEASRMPRPQAPPDMSQFEGLTTEQLLSGVQQRLDLRRRALEDDYRRRLLDESAAQGIFQPPVTQDVGTPVDQFIGEQRRAQRRSNLEAGLTLPQIQPPEPVVEPVVGQYPPEGFTTGSIPSQEEQARRAQVREEAARRGQLRAQQARQESQVPQEPQPLPSQLFPAPEPVAPVGRDLRAQALAVASRQQFAQAQADARRRAQEMKSRPISTTVIDVLANEKQVAQGSPLPDVQGQPTVVQAEAQAAPGTPLQEGANPQVAEPVYPKGFKPYIDEYGNVAERWRPSRFDLNNPPAGTDVGIADFISRGGGSYMWRAMGGGELSKLLSGTKTYGGNVSGRGNYLATYPEKSAKIEADYLIEFAGAKPDGEKSKNKLTLDNVTRILVRENGQWRPLTDQERQGLVSAKPTPTKSGVRLRKTPLRSDPAAAPSNATLGAGAGVSPAPAPALAANESVFGVRPYKGAPTITRDAYNQVNEAVDQGIAASNPTAKQIRDLDADAENGVKKSAGYERLSSDGQFEAVQRYRNKLYQSALKWVETGTFSFNQATIAKSVAMDVGKSGKEKMEQRVTGEEAVGESETETNLTRATTQVSPQIAPVGKTPRARQDAVAVLKELQSRLGLTSKELVNLVAAYQNQTTDELNDREMEAYEAALPTLQKLGSLDFSVSSLIAEPLGQARTQEAVDAWMESMGNPDILIRVVEDANLKTPDGRNVAAQIQLVPGGVPIITINALHVGSAAEVREKIWHEILHPVWEDPAVQKAWGEVVAQLSEADVQAQLARGYSPFEATMEAAIYKASIRAANSKVRPAWQRLLDSIWQALKGAFGFETQPKNFEALMVSALRSAAGPWNGQGADRYSVANNLYVTQPQRFQRVAEEGQTEAVVAQGQTASAIIPQSTLDEIAALEQKQDPSPVEKATLSNLKGVRQIAQVAAVADQIRQANEGEGWGNYRTLNDLPDAYKSVAAQSIMATHLYLNQRYVSLKNRQARVASQITLLSNKLNDLTESRLLARVSEQEADQLLKDLQSLIDLEVKKVGTSSASRTLDELNKASAAVVGLRQKQDAIAAALQAIAKEAPLADFASPEAMKAWIESRQADKTKSPLMTDEIATAIRASLKPGSGLPDRLSLIRGLMADTAAAKGQIKDLKAKVGNPKTALKQIIALKVDANSVLNQVARLDRSLEKQLIQLDGLDAAIAAMDRMQVSPQYQARVESVFQYGGFKYSGIIRYTDRPNGDQTLIGPSGKEYTVNFTPDYTVEKANLDRIGDWMEETIEAVYNPNSPTYITDPAKRTSYGNTLAYVARYLTDRRWLYESAWQDSKAVQLLSSLLLGMEKAGMLKAVWGDHLDTRFNAYRLMAGRAGGELVKLSRAIDTFGARAKNLIERTKEPLAVARRKAIESHGFNPDDAADIAIWNRKVNSWILSQNQNPGSTPVKEGDSIGEGLVATKEDLLFAEMQHKFSRELGDIYSGTEVDGATKDPNAPGLSPEEQLFGLDFSRKAMQYGYSIGRQFSEAGQEYTREWMGARAKDLAEHKRRVAEAPEGTEVPMVWDERIKVAEADIEGHVYSHIRESSTDYTPTAGKALRAAYKEVGKMIRRGTQFTTLNDIAEELAPMLSTDEVEVGATEAKEALLKALDKDAVNYNRATELVTQPSNDPTVSDLPKALAAVRSAKGALVKARGKMVAPSFFYDYSLDTDAKRAGMVHMGKQALQISEINAARNMLAAMRAKLAEYDTRIEARAQQLGRNGKKIGTWSATRELEKDLQRKFKAGELMITYEMLSRTANKLETLIKDREDALSRQRVMEEEAFKVALLNAGAGAVASTLLSAPSPIINNLTAVVLDPLRVGLMHGGIGFALTLYSKQALRAVKYVFQKGTDKILRKLGLVLPKRLREKLMDVSWELFSDMLTHRQELEDSGGIEGAEPFSSIWSRYKANPLSFGDTTRAKETAVSRAISRVLTSPFLGKGLIPASFEYLRQRFPGAGDRLVNYTNSLLEKELSDRVKLKLWLWVDGLEGSTRDQKIKSASSQTIQPDDIGLTKEELANYRTTYSSTGSLERLAIDYYLRNPNGAKGELLTPEQRDGVVFELVSLTNKEVDSTRPDITKGGAGIGGALKSKAFLFMRYMLQLIGVQKRVFGLKGGADWKDEFGQAAAYLFLLAMTLATGAFVLPFKQASTTLIKNEPLTSPTITQVAENPELLGKYLTAAAVGVMSSGASLVGALASGQPLMGPITANVLENNPLVGAANNLIGAATQAYQSGDVTYPALDWARKQVWFSQSLINALLPGEAMAREAKRAVRTGAVGMEVRESGGAPAQTRSTPMTPIIRDAVAALYEGDDAKFQAAKQRALNFFTDKGLDAKEAEARFNSSISGRDPFRSVLGRNPTEEEMGAIMARATPSQRATLSRARSGFSLRKKRSGLRIRSSKRRPSRRRVRLRKPSRA